MIWSALVVIAFVYALNWYFKTKDYRRKLSKIKCEPSLPFLGHALKLGNNSRNILEVLERMWINVGKDKFIFKLGPIAQVVLTHPDDIEVILTNTVLLKKNVIYDGFKSWIGEGLVTSYGSKWKVHRKLLTPAFHFKVVESFVDVYENNAKEFLQKVLENQNLDIEIVDLVTLGISNCLTQGTLGMSFASDEDLHTFVETTIRLETILNGNLITFWKQIDVIYNLTNEHKTFTQSLNVIHSIVHKIVKKKREELNDLIEAISAGKTSIDELTTGTSKYTSKKMTFIEILLLSIKPDGQPLSSTEIDDEINTFMLAGLETTSKAISFTLHALAQHPEIQENVYQEQLDITNGDLSKPLTYADLQNMKYLDRVIKESLRLYSISSFTGRELTEDITLKDGTELPAGCNVLVLTFLTHRNPDLFKDPLKFDPDRFLQPIPLYSYIPFSAGPRNCIGQKLSNTLMKSWLATITRSCILRPSETKVIELVLDVTLSSKNGIHLQFEKR